MATLVVTFTHVYAVRDYDAPIAKGSAARTETLTMPDESSAAEEGELVVELLADADCWVAIGTDPDTTAATDGTRQARKLLSGVPYQFSVEAGDKVVVAAA